MQGTEVVYYFSGTGNSRTVAQQLGRLLSCEVREMDLSPEVSFPEGTLSCLGLVFPVYAWGLPAVVAQFVRRLPAASCAGTYLWAVMTCGDDVGFADRVLNRALVQSIGRMADAVCSVPMPNTYVCLPGFDVDAGSLAVQKVRRTASLLPELAQLVRQRTPFLRVTRGSFPFTKTYVLRPLFNRFLVTDRHFHVRPSRCVQCGLCSEVCPTGNIRLGGQGVVWGQTSCVGCLRCYHLCPHRAIEWGGFTNGKGQHHMDERMWLKVVSSK